MSFLGHLSLYILPYYFIFIDIYIISLMNLLFYKVVEVSVLKMYRMQAVYCSRKMFVNTKKLLVYFVRLINYFNCLKASVVGLDKRQVKEFTKS